MPWPYRATEKWDVHSHTTLSPQTYAALERFTHYVDFIRVRAHETKPCCAQMVNSAGTVVRVIEENSYDGAARLKDCDKHDVSVQVLSPTPMMIPDYVDNAQDAADICRILNDDNAATVAKFPKRFVAIGTVPLRFPDLAIAEMERIRNTHDMRGIEINSNVNGVDLDEPAFFPVFAAAEKMGMAIFVHPWGGFMSPAEESLKKRMNPARNWRPWLVAMGMETALAFDALRSGRMHERLPKLRVLYAHGGGTFPALLGRLEHGAYCRPDLFSTASPLDPYKTVRDCSVYVDTLVHHPAMLGALVDMLGAGRIAMGSDYPYPLGEIDPFDTQTLQDPKGNICPYPAAKGIYPGYTIEHLPDAVVPMAEALAAFPWVAGLTHLPRLNNTDKQRILSGTAKEWLGYA